MSRRDSIERVWDIIEKVGVCMLTTRFAGGLRARPLEARPNRAASLIWFITDLRSGKDDEIEAAQDVGLVFIDAKDKAYLSITARAEVVRDPAKAAEIWKKTDDAWWDGPRDPNVRVLRVEPLTAELWDGPASAAVAAYEFAKARVTGQKPNLGENRKVVVQLSERRRSRRRADGGREPSAVYRSFWEAIRTRQQIICSYGGGHREACPTILGYNKDEREAVLVFQFGGESTTRLPPGGEWRCFDLARVTDLRLRSGPWHGEARHSAPQPCIRYVDVDVNIPETLTRERPLAFGSPELRPPRRSP
ncbi:MAG: pyridoxamine 5'-phosphate oxidase family protein [Xanthobacteraceae bacterium]|jgi:general stress protein 26